MISHIQDVSGNSELGPESQGKPWEHLETMYTALSISKVLVPCIEYRWGFLKCTWLLKVLLANDNVCWKVLFSSVSAHLIEKGQCKKYAELSVVFCYRIQVRISSVQFSRSVVSDSLWSHELQHIRPPVHHQLPEFTETHVHRVSDAIQSSHPLSSPSPPAPNPSQHQSLFQWVNSSHEVAKVLEFQL